MSLKKKLENCLQRAVENQEAAGVSVLVRQDGKDLCFASAGMADSEAGKPIRRDSIFRLYSQSKCLSLHHLRKALFSTL